MECPKCSDLMNTAGLSDNKEKQRWECPGCGFRPVLGEPVELLKVSLTKAEKEIISLLRKTVRIAGGDEIEHDRDSITIKSEGCLTEQDFVEKYNISKRVWYCERFKPGTWESAMKMKVSVEQEDGKMLNATLPIRIQHMKSEATFRLKGDVVDIEKFRLSVVKNLKRHSLKVARHEYPAFKSGSGNLFIPNIYDLHLGKLCWHEETGHDYDTKIAAKKFSDGMNGLVSQAMMYDIEKIVFPVGNDFFNYDYAHPFPQTTGGTPQESDARWQKMFMTGVRLIEDEAEKLSKIAPVEIVIVPGNHDTQTCYYLGAVLEAKFHANENITVNNSPATRKYVAYGTNLIGFTHGKNEKPVELHTLMSTDNVSRDLWSSTKYRYFYLGHNHRQMKYVYRSAEDHRGMIAECLPSVSPTDDYEYSKGWVNSINSVVGMVHNFSNGRIATFTHNF